MFIVCPSPTRNIFKMLRFRYQKFFRFSSVTFCVAWALILFDSLEGVFNGEWGTLFHHFGKNLDGLKANRCDVLQNSDDDLILIFDDKRFFGMQYDEPLPGQSEIRCYFHAYPNKEIYWPVLWYKKKRPSNAAVTLALAAKFADKHFPFDPVHCNRRHYMHYILYGETTRSKQFKECPLAAPLAGVTVDQIKNQSFKLMDSNGGKHDFSEYAKSKKQFLPDQTDLVVKRAASFHHRSSCRRLVERMYSLFGVAKRRSSRGTILKRVKLEASDGRPPLRYRIQLVDESSVIEAAEFMDKHYTDSLRASLACDPSNETDEEPRLIRWVGNLLKGFSVAAFLEDKHGNRGPMIGCNVLDLAQKRFEKIKHAPKQVITYQSATEKIWQTVKDLDSKVDVFTLYKCTSYMVGAGLTVDKDYQGRGIATELIRARSEVCRMLNVPVDATIFSGAASQRAAQKCGYKTIAELDLRTYRINGQIVYPNIQWPVIKIMAKRYY